ncbi:hypothetical protein MNBD_BACTEROID07-24 [hydrothermal vent metagenome]|uniref:Uncharacterized protein n=1 Tax=hydrothermal vent metagenome TaxID=652676 RepID=A0A3B0UE35_9ZZZZ
MLVLRQVQQEEVLPALLELYWKIFYNFEQMKNFRGMKENIKRALIFVVVFNLVGDGILYLLSGTQTSFGHIFFMGLFSSVIALILFLLIRKIFATQNQKIGKT